MALPATAKQVTITKLGTNFREVTEIRDVPVPKPQAGQVLVKNKFVGINASDINLSSGRYDPTMKPPFPAGLEGIGPIVAVGEGVTNLKIGQAVAFLQFGTFAEYVIVPADKAVPVPSTDPGLLSIVLSGLTASISLEQKGNLKAGETVLVTAAAGGTGQFAVQIAKLAGCHVIGTCSSPEKVDFLKSIGCDRVINYKKENFEEVIKKEYSNKLDVVYECVGKEMFDVSLQNLAIEGRLIVIGAISGYENAEGTNASEMISKLPVGMACLRKSASVLGFFLPHYVKKFPLHIATLAKQYAEGKIKVNLDKGENVANGPFKGLEKTVDAVEHMFSRKNIGKVIVEL
ncbi:prostaglandin reductase-3 [Aplysia californica]|uniref:Prostaglandin reductase-3 n=1 Tax=Aplysia californica TaxID=6500 RepID=A0ABM0JRS1_APLCA|nr:prostaglandin reductase-3 [Aplysia californica]XP_005100050.1 prostaglandin reductase-3 [Aplysia californica]XP_005100051.1 prostaglandin reductase-3 [Aplysia californica]XP_012938898.1 prostaglandin reductase-3 [Aplysia californica]XP_035826082.1 prostaglandin reductase-3 [Aplysia californica]